MHEYQSNRHWGTPFHYNKFRKSRSYLPPLPRVDWSKVGKKAPVRQKLGTWNKETSSLPKVDFVLMVDTSAEWSALDQVFLDPKDDRKYWSGSAWQRKWYTYGKGWSSIENELTYKSPSKWLKAWGRIAVVTVGRKRVLLVKTDMHIGTDGPEIPLFNFVEQIIQEAQPKLFLTSGTAGGAQPDSKLGDVSVTNSARFDLSGEFSHQPFKNELFKNAWEPQAGFDTQVTPLLNPVPAKDAEYRKLLKTMNAKYGYSYTLSDVLNDNTKPSELGHPKITFFPRNPVLTTNGYQVANLSGNFAKYAAMEMDDAAIAKVCDEHSTAFGCVRNISDPAVNTALGQKAGSDWASSVYQTYGLYSTFNGSLAAWSILDLET